MRLRAMTEPPPAKRSAFYRAIKWQNRADEMHHMLIGASSGTPQYAFVNCQNAAAKASRKARAALFDVIGATPET
jgi:hypothetical protein